MSEPFIVVPRPLLEDLLGSAQAEAAERRAALGHFRPLVQAELDRVVSDTKALLEEAQTGHAIPQWLRDRFDAIELEVRKMGAEGVFTQMRTKVQAYFEMLRSVERGKAGRDMHIIAQQKNLITSLRADLQEAIAIDCDDDAIDACAEVERIGTPGSVIREMNDELVDLRKLNFELRGAARCEHLHHCLSEQHDFNEPCKVLDRIDAAMGKEVTP